jgi:hypothetical protein
VAKVCGPELAIRHFTSAACGLENAVELLGARPHIDVGEAACRSSVFGPTMQPMTASWKRAPASRRWRMACSAVGAVLGLLAERY